jgi:hypothetical protein
MDESPASNGTRVAGCLNFVSPSDFLRPESPAYDSREATDPGRAGPRGTLRNGVVSGIVGQRTAQLEVCVSSPASACLQPARGGCVRNYSALNAARAPLKADCANATDCGAGARCVRALVCAAGPYVGGLCLSNAGCCDLVAGSANANCPYKCTGTLQYQVIYIYIYI